MNYRRAIRYQVSDEFKAECKANVNRYNRLGRIYVLEDNIRITENDNLVSFEVEDDCYVNDKFIGSVVSKKITVNILNPNNAINLENKTIQVNTGIDFNGTQELIPIGKFIIQKPDNKEVKENTTFTGYDEIIKFNKPYKDLDYENLDIQGNPQEMAYPIKVKDFLRKLCLQVGVDYIYESIVNEDYYILGNPFTNGENCRTVLSNIAQLCGGFAKMGRDNRLHIVTLISAQNDETIVDEIDGNNYDTTFSKNNIYGEVNSLILRLSQVEGENTVREDATSIAENGLTEITIADNYFLTDNSQRELVIDNIWNALKGLKYLPISTDYYGYPYLDSGDLIKVLDSEDNEFYTYIFNHSFKYDGSYSGKIETVALTKTQTAYKNTQNLNNKFKNVEFIVNKIDGKIESLIEEISDISEITTSGESSFGKVSLENINQSEPIRIEVRPLGTNISYLYPRDNLYPSDDLFMPDRIIRFKNTTTNEVIDYELPDDLLYYDTDNYDEFILNYEDQTCIVKKKVEYNADGSTYVLSSPTIRTFEYPTIELTDGDYEISLPGYDNVYLFVRLMAKNLYTDQFATRIELGSKITETRELINLSVDKKLSNYSTTTQMNSAIALSASSILSSVSETYATKDTTNTLSSRIKQTAKTIELTTTDNKTSAGITIKLKNEDGTQIDSKSANITLSGLVKFTDLKNSGSTEINGANITTGKISAARLELTDYLTISSASNTYATKNGLSNGTTTINGGCITTGTIKSSNYKSGETGTSINLSTGVIDTKNFKVDKNGNMTCANGKFSGKITSSTIELTDSGKNSSARLLIKKENDNSKYSYVNSEQHFVTDGTNDNYIEAGRIFTGNMTDFFEVLCRDGEANISLTKNNLEVFYADEDGVQAPSFKNTSLERIKKNIVKQDINALEIISNSDIYTYNLKSEANTEKKHFGFVIGEKYNTPLEVISGDGQGIEQYSMSSIEWIAIQQLMTKIESLEARILELEGVR